MNGWTPARDVSFIFCLLGKVAGQKHEGHEAREIGELVAYALLRGDAFDSAISFGLAVADYDRAIVSLARRVANAMRFLAEDRDSSELRGRPVSTLGDMLRMGRKFNDGLAKGD